MNGDTSNMQQASLESITGLRLECDRTDFVIEGDPTLDDVVRLIVEPAENAPVLRLDGDVLVIEQIERYRGKSAPVLRVPTGDLPALSGEVDQGGVTIEQAQFDIELNIGKGDLQITQGAGSIVLAIGQGETRVRDHQGSFACRVGSGDVHIDRSSGPFAVQTGSGDIVVTDCDSDLAIQTGSGDVVVRRPDGQSIVIKAGKGNVFVKDGSVVGLNVKLGKGDIVSKTRFLVEPEPWREHEERGVPDAEESVQFNLSDLEFQAGESGVRITRGGRDLFRAGPEGVRVRGRDGSQLNLGPEGIRVGPERGDKDRFSLVTDKGDVTIDVPDDAPVRVELIINRGTVSSDIPLVEVGRPGPRGTRRRFVGVSNSAEGERSLLRAKSDRGDIVLHLVSMADGGFSATESGTAQRDARVRSVLESLARGEISPDEANTLLRSIERET